MKKNLAIIFAGLAVLLVVVLSAVWLSRAYGDKENNLSGNNSFLKEIKSSESDGVNKISSAELNAMLATKDFVLIDVHVPEQEHIIGTDLFIPYDQILQSDQLPADKNQKIVLYCRSGNMSESAAKSLVEAGYTQIYDLAGGTIAYSDFLAKMKREASQVRAQVGFIDFYAELINSENFEALALEYDGLADLGLDLNQTNILLLLDNHRVDLTGYNYQATALLDGEVALAWQPLSEAVGGHHIGGVLTFEQSNNPKTLLVSGLPVGDATLFFTDQK